MRLSILPCLALVPVLASADTLVLRNGNRFDGTFVSGSSRRITFVDETGRQRVFDMTEVQELSFGPATGAGTANTVAELGTAVSKLRRDLREAMDKVTLEAEDRRMLERVSETLRVAAIDRRDGSIDYVDRRDVGDAIRDLEAFLDRGIFRDRDRDVIMADIQHIRELRRATRPDNTYGTRSRSRGYDRYR
ncbi:MAG TPA: hypothetical protein VFL57_20785 [Bryobacteraceae bacterium]|nr:hypothetical protein [Bryobacteraceae bacterium]